MSLLGEQLSAPAPTNHDVEQVLLGLADGSYVLSTPEGVVAECGIGLVALLGAPVDELTGRSVADVLASASDPDQRAAFEQLLRGDPAGAGRAFRTTAADGSARSLRFTVVSVPLALGWEFTSLLSELGSRDADTWHPEALRLRHARALEAVEGVCVTGSQPDAGARLAGILVVVRESDAPPLTREDVGRRMEQQRAAAREAKEAERRAALDGIAAGDAVVPEGPGLEDLVGRAHLLRERLEEAEQDAAEAHAERERVLEQLATAEAERDAQLAAARAREEQTAAQLAERERELVALSAAQASRDGEGERALAQLAAAQSAREQALAALAAAQSEGQQVLARLNTAQAERERALALVNSERAERERALARLQSGQSEHAQALARLAAIEAERDAEARRRAAAEAHAETMRETGDGRAEQLAAALEQAQAATAVAEAEVRRAHAELEAARAGAQAARAEAQAVHAQAQSARAASDEARAESEAARGEHALTHGKLAALRGELDRARGELEATRRELDGVRSEPAVAPAELQAARAELRDVRGELEARSRELGELRAGLGTRDEQIERLRRELDDVRDKLNVTRAAAAQDRAEREQAQRRADQLLGEAERARTAADAIRAEFAFETPSPVAPSTAPQPAPRSPFTTLTQPPAPTAPVPAAEPALALPPCEPGIAAALIGLDGTFKRLDEAFCSLLGAREDELRNARWPSIIDRDNLKAHQELARALRAGEIQSAEIETVYMHARGLLVPVEGTVSMHREGSGQYFLFRADVRRTSGAAH